MIRLFGRCIIVAILAALFTPAVVFGFATIFAYELIARIVYAESVLDYIDVKGLKKYLYELLIGTKEYIIG